MTRIAVFRFLVTFTVCLACSSVAVAQKTPREQAKEHFNKGFAYYQAKQYLRAVRELKIAYKIRPVPLVLFYIGKTYQAAQLDEESITYFRKFLDEARLTDPNRKVAKEAIKAMGGTIKGPPAPRPVVGPAPTVTPRPTPRPTVAPKPRRRVKRVKPGEIIHEPVEEARPHLPLLVEAELPDEIEWARLYVYFRPPGMEAFVKKVMKPGRRGIYSYLIHHSYLRAKSLQYYIEAVGRTGKRIAGSGTATSPNIVLLSNDAPMQPGGRMDDKDSAPTGFKGEGKTPAGAKIPGSKGTPGIKKPSPRWNLYAAVGLSAATVALLASGLALSVSARYRAQDMADRGTAKLPDGWVYPPDRVFDSELKNIQDQGKAYEIGSIVCYVLSAAAAGGATYLWLRYFKVIGKKEAEPASTPAPQPAAFSPMVGKNTVGLSYGLKF